MNKVGEEKGEWRSVNGPMAGGEGGACRCRGQGTGNEGIRRQVSGDRKEDKVKSRKSKVESEKRKVKSGK